MTDYIKSTFVPFYNVDKTTDYSLTPWAQDREIVDLETTLASWQAA
jgi:hypothetical protein